MERHYTIDGRFDHLDRSICQHNGWSICLLNIKEGCYRIFTPRARIASSCWWFTADPAEVALGGDSLCFCLTQDHAGRLSCSLARCIDNNLIMRHWCGNPLFWSLVEISIFSAVGPDLPDYKQLAYNWDKWDWEHIFAMIDFTRLKLIISWQNKLLTASWVAVVLLSSRNFEYADFQDVCVSFRKVRIIQGLRTARTPRGTASVKFNWCRRFWRRL